VNEFFLNIISAIAVGIIILIMALLKSGYLKALIYSLPIPITIALIATGGTVNETNIIGLFLLILYLWLMVFLVKRGMNVYVADIVAVIAYVVVGYVAITYIKLPFEVTLIIYAIFWVLYAILYRHKVSREVKSSKRLNPVVKFPIVTITSFILFSLKSYLSGVVVTFPFSGVFAVIESRGTLRTLAAMFTGNSIGILALFGVVYYLGSTNLVVKILAGWASYFVIVFVVGKVVKYVH
jgi:hypothetical protein